MTLTLIPHTHVDLVWGQVAPLIERSCADKASGGEWTVDQVRMAVVEKAKHLIVSLEDDIVTAAATVEFVNYPNKRVAYLGSLGGRDIVSVEVFEKIKGWCREMGASELRAYAKEAQARLYAKVGMGKLYNVVGVEL